MKFGKVFSDFKDRGSFTVPRYSIGSTKDDGGASDSLSWMHSLALAAFCR
jgi:hypothetical protein